VLYALPLAFLLPDAPPAADRSPEPKSSPGQAVTELLANPSFILLVLYFTLPVQAGWVVRDWMPGSRNRPASRLTICRESAICRRWSAVGPSR
jgi:hypothetical protein